MEMAWTGSCRCLGSEFHIIRLVTDKAQRQYELGKTAPLTHDWRQNAHVTLN